tara:strand:- start:490 stop:660 length:171 start_codon:yes stop_codon:yes gene_type:complete
MKRKLLVSLFLLAIPTATFAGECYYRVAWTNPDLLNCEQSGTNRLGKPIWLCCDPW